MNFSERSKYILVESVKELMNTIPLDKITVSQIVENCGTTRQTFYRYFKDKYDLILWYFDVNVQSVIEQMWDKADFKAILTKKLTLMKEEQSFYASAFSSRDSQSIFEYNYRYSLKFYTEKISKKIGGELPEEVQFMIELYCYGFMVKMADWAQRGMPVPPKQFASMLIDSIPGKLVKYLGGEMEPPEEKDEKVTLY